MSVDRDWMVGALCTQTDPEVFFPAFGAPNRQAKQVCSRCTVTAECLSYALARDEHGIWSGLSREERQRLKRHLRTEPDGDGD